MVAAGHWNQTQCGTLSSKAHPRISALNDLKRRRSMKGSKLIHRMQPLCRFGRFDVICSAGFATQIRGLQPASAPYPQQADTTSPFGAQQPAPQSTDPSHYATQPSPAYGATFPAVQAPLVTPEAPGFTWQFEHMNNVKLIGSVGAPPEIRQVGSGKVVANVRLGIRPPPGRGRSTWSWLDVEFWDDDAINVGTYVRKGSLLAVGGYFKQDTWISKLNQQEVSKMKVVADYFQVVDPSVGSLMNFTDPPPAPNSFTSTSIRSTGGRDTDLDIQYYNAWKSNPELTWMEAAQQQNRNPDSLIRNITEALFSDKLNIEERDAVRLANELSIGPPDSPWLDFATLSKTIDEVISEEKGRSGQEVDVHNVRLKPMLEKLQSKTTPHDDHPSISTRTFTQLSSHPSLGLGATYAQLRFVKAMKAKGIDLSSAITANPVDLEEAFKDFPRTKVSAQSNGYNQTRGPQASQYASFGNQYQQPFGGQPVQNPPPTQPTPENPPF